MAPLFRALVLSCLSLFTSFSIAATSDAIWDRNTLTLTIPAVSVKGAVYTNAVLKLNSDGVFSIQSVGAPLAAGTTIPAGATFVFPEIQRAVIPKAVDGANVYSAARVALLPNDKLGLVSIDGPVASSNKASSVSNIAAALTLPTNIDDISYPTTYTNAAPFSTDVDDVLCNLTPGTISFPASYMGSYPLPFAKGAPFPPAVKLGVVMKDGWLPANPTMNVGCDGDARVNFLRTLLRLKALGASYVELTPWTLVDTSKAAWQIAKPGPATNNFIMSDEDLEWAVNTAHSQGLQVVWRNQIQAALDFTIPAATPENVTKFMVAYEPYMLERAAFLQRIGVDEMMVGCVCWFFPNSQTEGILVSRLGEVVPKIRTIFQGRLMIWMWTPKIYSNPALINAIDLVELYPLNPSLSQAELGNLTVDLVKSKMANIINGWKSQITNAKPIAWTAGVPSRGNYFGSGYYEETNCTSGTNVVSQTGTDCIQKLAPTDFSFQAMVQEGMLEAFKEQTYFTTYSVKTDAYWLTDGVNPGSTFPNIAVSIRNKPAETLLKQWFNR